MLSFDYNRMSKVFDDVNVGVKNHNFQFSIVLEKYNFVIVT